MSSFLWQAIEWHYDELPPSNPYKKYLVAYAPWDYNRQINENPRLEIAEYYPGEEPKYIYSKAPWHLDVCHSAIEKEILCWADAGNVEDIVKKFLEVQAESEEYKRLLKGHGGLGEILEDMKITFDRVLVKTSKEIALLAKTWNEAALLAEDMVNGTPTTIKAEKEDGNADGD